MKKDELFSDRMGKDIYVFPDSGIKETVVNSKVMKVKRANAKIRCVKQYYGTKVPEFANVLGFGGNFGTKLR